MTPHENVLFKAWATCGYIYKSAVGSSIQKNKQWKRISNAPFFPFAKYGRLGTRLIPKQPFSWPRNPGMARVGFRNPLPKILDMFEPSPTNLNWYRKHKQRLNWPFAGPGHVTYPLLNLRPGTLWVSEMKRVGKNKKGLPSSNFFPHKSSYYFWYLYCHHILYSNATDLKLGSSTYFSCSVHFWFSGHLLITVSCKLKGSPWINKGFYLSICYSQSEGI